MFEAFLWVTHQFFQGHDADESIDHFKYKRRNHEKSWYRKANDNEEESEECETGDQKDADKIDQPEVGIVPSHPSELLTAPM